MHDLDYLVTLTRLGHFPTELSRQIAVEKGITTVEALNIFVEGEERIRKVADALPDIYREWRRSNGYLWNRLGND